MNKKNEVYSDLISIIVPVFKTEEYLEKCINSIVTQSYKNLEVILVDDGSPDGCGKICDQWALKDERICVIHKPNGGLSDARNAGLEKAKGEYIGFVDSDDYIHQDMFERLWLASKKNDADFVICGFEHVDECGNPLNLSTVELMDETLDKDTVMRWVVSKNWSCMIWNKLYKKKLFNNIRFPYGKYYEDRMIMPWIIYNSDKVATIPNALYCYVHSANSITRLEPSLRRFDLVEAYYRNLKFFESKYPDLSSQTVNQLIEQYLLASKQVSIVHEDDIQRIKEIKKMVRYCYFKYWSHIRFVYTLNMLCPSLYNTLRQIKRITKSVIDRMIINS